MNVLSCSSQTAELLLEESRFEPQLWACGPRDMQST